MIDGQRDRTPRLWHNQPMASATMISKLIGMTVDGCFSNSVPMASAKTAMTRKTRK